jgi:phospholipid-translocating ATPase
LVTFYKAFAFSLPLFFYGFFSGASASFMYDAAFLSWFNVAFTNFPPFVLGLFEQDVDQKSLLRLPELYHAFQKTPSLRFGRFVYFNVLAVWQGFMIYFLTMHGPLEDVMIGGSLFSGSVYFEGNIAALLMCVVINLQMVFVSSFISKYTVGAAGFNIASFFLFFMIANSIDGFFGSDLYNLMPVVFGSPNAYFVVIITALLSFFPTLVFTSFQNFFRPSLLYELKAGLKAGRAVGSTKQFYNQIPMSTLS